MSFETNDAWRTMSGNRYCAPFYGDKGKAWQYLVQRQTTLVERIDKAERSLLRLDLPDRGWALYWLKQDRNELARVRAAMRARE